MFASLFFRIFARSALQSFFGVLHKFSLAGMNYGGGGSVSESGEIGIFRVIEKYASSPLIFDVGANVGDYTASCKKFLPTSEIFCFEPSSSAFSLLSNRFKQKDIHLFHVGLGEKTQKVSLYSDKNGSGLGSLYKRELNHAKVRFTKKEIVRVVSLDQLCKKEGIEHIDLLKLDVEGHELSILKGAQHMLGLGKIKFIQFEFGGCNIDSRTFFKDFYNLLSPQYDIFRIVQDGLVKMSEYREVDEIFVTTNYFAIQR